MNVQGTRRVSRWLAIIGVFALLAAACAPDEEGPVAGETETEDETPTETPDDTDEPTQPADAGTVVMGLEQEPNILNPILTEGNLFATSKVALTMLYPLWRITPDFQYEPLLLDGEPEVTSEDPFTVRYTLKEEATWSDGTPISADDLVFTLDVCLDEQWEITSRAGCDEVESTEVIDDKTVDFVFQRPYAPWRTLFSTADGIILPQHVLEGEDINTVWNDGIVTPDGDPIASGPFVFEEWNKGQQLSVVRNEDFWGEPAKLDRIVFRPITDVNTLVQQFRGGEVDVIDPQPQLDLIDQLEGESGLDFDVSNGPVWEHLDFNFDRGALRHLYVRQAIGKGIDREVIATELIGPMNPDAEVLNNVIYLNDQEEYEDHWSEVIGYDPDAAVALLEDNGCTRGDDEIFTCDDERLEFGFVTTGGNELRELTFEVIQQQLQEIGVQVNADFGEGGAAFERLAPRDWDLFLFAWVGAPDPSGGDTIWQCEETVGEQSLNYTGFCNPEVDELIQEQLETIDPQERAALYNEADALIAQGVPVIPLYQKPAFLGWNADIEGVVNNATQWGPTWNVEDWAFGS